MDANVIVGRLLTALIFQILISPDIAQSILDGRKFDTQAGLAGKAAHVKQDILSFEAGKFHSSDCDQYGYNKGDYKVLEQGDGATFFRNPS